MSTASAKTSKTLTVSLGDRKFGASKRSMGLTGAVGNLKPWNSKKLRFFLKWSLAEQPALSSQNRQAKMFSMVLKA